MFAVLLNDPFYTGSPVSSDEIPYRLPVAIGGHGYAIEVGQYRRRTMPAQREQINTGQPGEQALDPQMIWRVSHSNWIDGAGQEWLDREVGEDRRHFHTSKGINPWIENELTLLPATEQIRSAANTNLKLLAAQGHLYAIEGQTVIYTTDPETGTVTWSTATGTPVATAVDLTTDGSTVFVAFDSGGVYKSTLGGAFSSFSSFVADVIAYTNGWLLAAKDNRLVEINAAGAVGGAGQLDYSHDNTSFNFTHIVAASRAIYVAGSAGDHSELYWVEVDSSGALTIPRPATFLPEGETVTALASYGNLLLIGTTRGIRLAQALEDKSVVFGPVIEMANPVRCFEPQGEFAWFGWTNYDGTSTGLGRLNLANETASLVPAYASDLMADVQGVVDSVVTYNDRRYFVVESDGIWRQDTELVASGEVDSGWIGFRTTAPKATVAADFRHDPLVGSVALTLILEDGSDHQLALHSTAGTFGPSSPLSARKKRGEAFRIKLTLNRDATAPTTGPTLRSWTLTAFPLPQRTDEILVPIRLYERIENQFGKVIFQDVAAEFSFLKSLESAGNVIRYQEGTESYSVVIDGIELQPERFNFDLSFFEGLLLVRLVAFSAN